MDTAEMTMQQLREQLGIQPDGREAVAFMAGIDAFAEWLAAKGGGEWVTNMRADFIGEDRKSVV